ncbi:LOW QUALITY PROTEIN: uncharacterized protein [Primulina eburnea]|uniref:LOW QUALITY PROTEIN: uncharacterized protein n=1 Tax=Primulina eburnea TaxID=1245227 RepID=UPI003C6C039B
MENPRQFPTLKMSEATVLPFSPHLRRPIRSRTYFNLIQLISHFQTDISQLNGSGKGDGLRRGNSENIQINHGELKSAELLVPNDILVQGTEIYKSIAIVGFQDEILMMNEPQYQNWVVQTYSCWFNGTADMDNKFSIADFSEVLDSCFGGDMVSESSKWGNNSKVNNFALEVNTFEDFEHQVQLKQMELEKLVSTSGMDEEIEEGEIYGELGSVICQLMIDPLCINAASLGRISIQTSEDNGYKQDFTCKSEDLGFPRRDTCVIKENDHVKVEHRASSRPSLDIQSQSSAVDDGMETQGFDAIPNYLESLPLTEMILEKRINDDPISAITKKEGDGRTNKRKNGSSAKERNAEKKKRKRAEKNRKLGIRRLKLQTVSKPKKIVYCRHYLQGKCHEGEKCKFSHDTTPLTKSKPRGHFARNSCMKGDDCPYDHRLSKYPCNNYTSIGFCHRGADCLFSHEIPENQILSMTHDALKSELKSEQCKGPDKAGSFTASIVSRPEVKFLPQLYNSNSSNSSDILTSHQKDNAKLSSPGKSGKSTAKFVAKPFSRTTAHAPKGVCFLTDILLGQNHMLKLDESVQKSGDAVEVAHKTNPKVPSSSNKLNKKSEELTSRKPRGVNFLSFAQSSLDDSSFKTFENFFSDRFKEAGMLVLADLADGKQTCPLPKNGEFFEDHGPTSRNAINFSWNLNGEANRTPATIPLCNNSASQDKNQPDDSSWGNRMSIKMALFLSSTEEKPTTPCNLPVKLRLLPFGGSCDQSASAGYPQTISSSFKTSLLSNTPSLVQKAVQSTLAFAAKFESEINLGHHLP